MFYGFGTIKRHHLHSFVSGTQFTSSCSGHIILANHFNGILLEAGTPSQGVMR